MTDTGDGSAASPADLAGPIDLLVVSNGHGEDAIAAHLVAAIRRRYPESRIAAVPLVGAGAAYARAGIPLAFRSRPMPSEGFGWQQPRLLVQDMLAGFASLTAAQLDVLRQLRPRVRGLLLVGDIYPVLLTASYRAARAMVATARSDYISSHLWVETRVMRLCQVVLARDAVTARALERRGVAAAFVGNFMMDMVAPRGLSLGLEEGEPVVALLPGSRRDFPSNLEALAGVVQAVRRSHPQIRAVAALASEVAAQDLGRGWRLAAPTPAEGEAGLSGWMVGDDGARIGLTVEGFPDLLHRSTVVLGLSGTANEQAAGLGRPVVAFPRAGVQYTPRFAARQKRLLSDALVLCGTPEEAASQVARLLDHPEERARLGAAGRERMGPPGAAARALPIVEEVLGLRRCCPEPGGDRLIE